MVVCTPAAPMEWILVEAERHLRHASSVQAVGQSDCFVGKRHVDQLSVLVVGVRRDDIANLFGASVQFHRHSSRRHQHVWFRRVASRNNCISMVERLFGYKDGANEQWSLRT